MPSTLTLEEVRTRFAYHDLELLEDTFVNTKTKMLYRCNKCGYQNKTTCSVISYKNYKGCPNCTGKIHKYRLSDIEYELSKENYLLIDGDYNYSNEFLKVKCPNDHIVNLTFRDWKQGCRCKECYLQSVQPPFEFVKYFFKSKGYKLLSVKYRNAHSLLNSVCPNGHTYKVSWANFKNGTTCNKCLYPKLELPLYDTFKDRLSNYVKISGVTKTIDDIYYKVLGVECFKCGITYIPTKNEVYRKLYAINNIGFGEANFYCSEYCKHSCSIYGQKKYQKHSRVSQRAWAELVKNRDDNNCQVCGISEKIMYAHHIDPVINNPIESLDIDNGITLCKECHYDLHKLPGCSYEELKCKNTEGAM